MRVLHIIDKLSTGGAERVFIDLTRLLALRELQVDALLFDGSGELTRLLHKNLVVHVLDRVNKYSIVCMFRLHKICSEYTIVHVHTRHVYRYVRAIQLLFRGGYTILLHDHYGRIDVDKAVPRGFKHFLKPKNYIGVSKSLTHWATSALKISPEKVFLLRNTIIPASQSPLAANTDSSSRAMIVSNFSRIKNIEFAIALSTAMEWELDIYGNSRDESYFNHLAGQVRRSDKIRMISNVDDFSGLYANYSFAVHCARSESGPLVLLEYLANGIPFIAYKTGEVAEVIHREMPFLFMDTFDLNQWMRRIEEIKQIDNLPSKMRDVFDKYFSPEKYTDECLRIYERIGC